MQNTGLIPLKKRKSNPNCRKIVLSRKRIQVKLDLNYTGFHGQFEDILVLIGSTDKRDIEIEITDIHPKYKKIVDFLKNKESVWIHDNRPTILNNEPERLIIHNPDILFDDKPACPYKDSKRKYPHEQGWLGDVYDQ